MDECPNCKISWEGNEVNVMMVEYPPGHKERYDGISEYVCFSCRARVGRWTGKVLEEGEYEKRLGRS